MDGSSWESHSSGVVHEAVNGADRARLLEAIAECCADRGYPASTITQITERAGVSRERFHELFRDKEDCLLAAGNAILGETMTAATMAYSADQPLQATVSAATGAILATLSRRPAFARLALLEYRSATPRAAELYESGIRVLTSLLDQLRIDASGASPLPSSAARAAVGGAEALIRSAVADDRAESLPDIHPSVLYACLVPFLGPKEALDEARRIDGLPEL